MRWATVKAQCRHEAARDGHTSKETVKRTDAEVVDDVGEEARGARAVEREEAR